MWILGLKGLKSNMATTTTKMGLNCNSNEEKCNTIFNYQKGHGLFLNATACSDVAVPSMYDSSGNKSANIVKMVMSSA